MKEPIQTTSNPHFPEGEKTSSQSDLPQEGVEKISLGHLGSYFRLLSEVINKLENWPRREVHVRERFIHNFKVGMKQPDVYRIMKEAKRLRVVATSTTPEVENGSSVISKRGAFALAALLSVVAFKFKRDGSVEVDWPRLVAETRIAFQGTPVVSHIHDPSESSESFTVLPPNNRARF